MALKHIKIGQERGYIGDKPKRATKPRDIPEQVFLDMVRERDILWWKEGKFREFLEKRHGID